MNNWRRLISVPEATPVWVATRCKITGIREVKVAEFYFGSYIRVRINGTSKALSMWSEEFLCWQPYVVPELPEEGEFEQ